MKISFLFHVNADCLKIACSQALISSFSVVITVRKSWFQQKADKNSGPVRESSSICWCLFVKVFSPRLFYICVHICCSCFIAQSDHITECYKVQLVVQFLFPVTLPCSSGWRKTAELIKSGWFLSGFLKENKDAKRTFLLLGLHVVAILWCHLADKMF